MIVFKPFEYEMRFQSDWVKAILQGQASLEPSWPYLKPVKQGYDVCRLRRGLVDDKMVIGDKTYTRGIGTHSVSEIEVTLPESGRTFIADIGRDDNGITRGYESKIVFAVEANGQELFRSGSIKGGEPAQRIAVPLRGAKRFILRVDGTPHLGHADWANAVVELKNGRKVWLDELPFSSSFPLISAHPPFSFVYAGISSSELLSKWKVSRRTENLDRNRTRHEVVFLDPETGLEATCRAVVFNDFPAVEWVVEFRNTGKEDTPILENVQALDAEFAHAPAEPELVLHHVAGSNDSGLDFAMTRRELKRNSEFTLAPWGGRGSSVTAPFFNIEGSGGGMIAAIGWTGQWSAAFRDQNGRLKVTAGMELTHLKLHPGESIRTPKIMLLFWQGDRQRAHNMLRQFVLKHYTPRPNGKLLQTPISFGNWGALTEQKQLDKIKALIDNKIPFEYFWIDAGWYGTPEAKGDWAGQAGNWFCNPDFYPNGMKPISDALHKAGKKLILWVDPERVSKGTQLHTEHPDWLLETAAEIKNVTHPPSQWGMLLNLGHPAARRWVTDLISGLVKKEGIDVYRQDFNIDPLGFWRQADAPDRQGITEIRHIEGLYAFWDELLRRHPGLIIDNCASGGRRIDIETISRSVPLWRSDLQCSPGYSAAGSQAQTYAFSCWLPLHGCGCREDGNTYDFRSAISSGITPGWGGDICDRKKFPYAWARRMMAEATALRKYYYGNIYPLTSHSVAEDVWFAYQLDRPDLAEGAVLVYRRIYSPYTDAFFKLQGLRENRRYAVTFLGTRKNLRLTGRELMEHGLRIRIGKAPDSVIVSYRMETSKKG